MDKRRGRRPGAANATVTFDAVAADESNAHVNAGVYVGQYEGRATPIADTIASTPLGATAKLVPGTYEFVVQAPGYGLTRSTKTLSAGSTNVSFPLQTNWASSAKGASASGDGTDLGSLIDDSEGTNWTATGRTPSVAGTKVTVQLGGGAHQVSSVRVSAMIGPGHNRFTALRQFRIDACNASTANGNCSLDAGFSPIYTSPADAFPAVRPRPVAPDLILRTFDVTPTTATHLRLVVLTNQCTGGPDFQGDQDSDATNDSDCISGSARDEEVTAAELEAFAAPPAASADLAVTKTGPATVKRDQNATYTITVTNNGPDAATGVVATDTLPANADLRSTATTQGTCAAGKNATTVTCTVGNLAKGATATITVVAKLRNQGTATNTVSVSEAGPGDPNSANNTATASTTVT